MSSENVLNFLSQPATLASLAAVAAASMAYFTSRPTPRKCPVDPNQQSVEVPVSLTLIMATPCLPYAQAKIVLTFWSVGKECVRVYES